MDGFKTFRNDEGIVVVQVQSLKVSNLSFIPDIFYDSPKLKNWMCDHELCTFSQMQSCTLIFDPCKVWIVDKT